MARTLRRVDESPRTPESVVSLWRYGLIVDFNIADSAGEESAGLTRFNGIILSFKTLDFRYERLYFNFF